MQRRSRAPHSHTGCTECKARHVKCDETVPTCKRCLRHNRACSRASVLNSLATNGLSNGLQRERLGVPKEFQVIFHQLEKSPDSDVSADSMQTCHSQPISRGRDTMSCDEIRQQLSSGPSPQTISEEPLVLNPGEMELFRFFQDATAATMSNTAEFGSVLKSAVPRLAPKKPYLMYCVLTLAAYHKRHLSTDEDERRELELSIFYFESLTLSLYARAVDKTVSQDDCVATCITSILIKIGSYARFPPHQAQNTPGSFWAIDKIITELHFMAGITAVFHSRYKQIQASELAPLLYEGRSFPEPILNSQTTAVIHDLSEACSAIPASDEDGKTYAEALRGVSYAWFAFNRQPCDREYILTWVRGLTAGRFAQLLQRETPQSLLILAHYAPTLHKCGAWWAHGLGQALVEQICEILPREHAPLLAWPRKQVELDA